MYSPSFWLIAIYILVLPAIGLWARQKQREASLRDYYLAGGAISLIPLFFTLYATQYSGNTLFGMAGQAYREGPVILFTAGGMFMGIAFAFAFAKKLYEQAREKNHITMVDFLRERFGKSPLLPLANAILIFALASFILTNFKAAGLLIEAISGGSISLFWGVFILAVAMAIYESLGGMRGVVLTDMLQGSLLLMGCVFVFAMIVVILGGPSEMGHLLFVKSSEFWEPPSGGRLMRGVSIVLLLGFALSMYPHFIQRIYAAKSYSVLRRGFFIMLAMPLFTTVPIILSALAARFLLPELSGGQSEQIIPLLLQHLMDNIAWAKILLALFMAAGLAAIMSTIDSALLALGAIFTRDIIRPLSPKLSEKKLHSIGKSLSWLLMLVMAGFACILPQSIWALLVLKLELMLQLMPAMLLGARVPVIRVRPVLSGMVGGIVITVFLKYGLGVQPLNIHAGNWGLLGNFLIIFALHFIGKTSRIAPLRGGGA
ncbi:MAG: sodium:solute symporter family protein [Parvibaculales bacterium]